MIRIMAAVWFIGALLSTAHTDAAVIKTIDQLHPLKVVLSDRSFNRIAVESGGVRKIIAPEELFDIQIDEITCQAFLSVRESFDRTAAISVITDAGFVQDIEIAVEDRPTEMILLKEPREEEPFDSPFVEDAPIYALSTLAKGKLPPGYTLSSLQPEDRINVICPSLSMTPIQALEGPYDRIIFYSVRNTGNEKNQIKEGFISQPNDRWVYVSKEAPDPEEQIILIVARGKE